MQGMAQSDFVSRVGLSGRGLGQPVESERRVERQFAGIDFHANKRCCNAFSCGPSACPGCSIEAIGIALKDNVALVDHQQAYGILFWCVALKGPSLCGLKRGLVDVAR